MTQSYSFAEIARLPDKRDNVAVAVQRLEAGARVNFQDRTFSLDSPILVGHRFAVNPICVGEPLLSWNMPFGLAIRDILPGEYVCNAAMMAALAYRSIDFDLPNEPNFEDLLRPYELDKASTKLSILDEIHESGATFMGYRRGDMRGVGTRNIIVILGTSSQTSAYVKLLAQKLQESKEEYLNVDAVVAVAHTEGGGTGELANNQELVLRTLAGFTVHPNIGAVLLVDYGWEPVNNQRLRNYMQAHNYALEEVLHEFMSIEEDFGASLLIGESIVKGWLGAVNGAIRTVEPLSEIKIALQCGGSDAFSGISGNPLAAWVARKIVWAGGMANVAETPELAGAEAYMLQKVSDPKSARRFLSMIERFKVRATQHGATIEANTSGGNMMRGLYNITLKSLGAATKRHPDQSLDFVIEYSEPMRQPGFYFMDSPGLDLESIAGQVASGCNLILFVTGNGSVTNFPFVPTIKIVTTSDRFQMLKNEMDVNAGKFLEGYSMDDLGREMTDLAINVASGHLTRGEKAGHSQVQIWRNWQKVSQNDLGKQSRTNEFDGQPIILARGPEIPDLKYRVMHSARGYASRQFGLILPTSLCSSQVARIAAEKLNNAGFGRDRGLSRFLALGHTEGCASSSGLTGHLFSRVMVGYACHPLVRHCLFLEHGCEVTHNDYFKHFLMSQQADPSKFGWASVQLDGGIEDVTRKIGSWFLTALINETAPQYQEVGLESLRLGIHTIDEMAEQTAEALEKITRVIVLAGGTVVIPDTSSVLATLSFLKALSPSLAHGQQFTQPGLYVMDSQSDHWLETITGLGASGVEIILAYSGRKPIQGHELVPVMHLATESDVQENSLADYDLNLNGDPASWYKQVLEKLVDVLAQRYTPKAEMLGNTGFQITRGLLGLSF